MRRANAVSLLSRRDTTANNGVWSATSIAAKTSVAVSPIAGNIFINDSKRFVDGIVSEDEARSIRTKVASYIRTRMLQRGFNADVISSNA